MVVAVNWIPVSAAAKMLGVSNQRVAVLCKTGQLSSQKIERTVLVNLESVRARVACQQRGFGFDDGGR